MRREPDANLGSARPRADQPDFQERRRKALKTGALVVPTILTIHASPAWAQTDYTITAYRYGDNAGLCRNPHFNPRANPDSQAGQEFIECGRESGRGGLLDTSIGEQQTTDSGPVEIQDF